MFLTLWTLALAASAIWNVQLLHDAMLDAAERDGRSGFERDALYLLNPDAMTRGTHELKAHEDGLLGHITSLKPKRPENAPDAWEAAALRTFERGQTEAIARVQSQGHPYLRVMKPVVTVAVCMQCHAAQGYHVGDIRGGISVAVPLEPYLAMAQDRTGRIAGVHAGLWVLGALGIFLSARQVRRRLDERKQAAVALRESEERYRTVIENVGEGISLVNTNEQFTFVNPAAEDIFGVPRYGLLGRSLHDFTAPDQFERIRAQTAKRQAGEKSAYDLVITRPNGEQRTVLVSAVPQFDGQGKFVGTFGVFRDITERRRAQNALQESEERFRVIFSKSAIGIALVDAAGRPFLTNAACQRILGRTAEELRAMVFTEFTHPEDCDKDLDLYRELIAGERDSYQIDKRYFRKDGQLVWTSLSVSLIRDPAGQPKFALSLVEDITERKQVEAERERVIGELRGTLAETKTLSGLIPICAGCKKIRDDQDNWKKVEVYIQEHTGAKFTHGICPECIKKYYPGIDLP